MNVLDLCFFRSLQSLTDSRAPTTIKELINDVEQEYKNYEVDTLAKYFLTLQTCMIEVMKVGGGMNYHPPHKGKDQLIAEGILPLALCIPAELLTKTLALIEQGGDVEKAGGEGEVEKGGEGEVDRGGEEDQLEQMLDLNDLEEDRPRNEWLL